MNLFPESLPSISLIFQSSLFMNCKLGNLWIMKGKLMKLYNRTCNTNYQNPRLVCGRNFLLSFEKCQIYLQFFHGLNFPWVNFSERKKVGRYLNVVGPKIFLPSHGYASNPQSQPPTFGEADISLCLTWM